MSKILNGDENYFTVNSILLEVCQMSRCRGSKICTEQDYSSTNKGYCTSQSMHYYGYKLHAVCSVKGVVTSFDISLASVHDMHYLKEIKHQMNDCGIMAYNGYLSTDYQLDLFTSSKIKLEVPMRNNQRDFKQYPYI